MNECGPYFKGEWVYVKGQRKWEVKRIHEYEYHFFKMREKMEGLKRTLEELRRTLEQKNTGTINGD